EDVGVLLVDDVTPYELMKLRLLNAGHQALCYFAYLAGYRLVADAAGDPLFAKFLLDYMDNEATPTLKPVPGIDLPDFKKTAIARFANPAVRDTIVRLCFGSSDRIPQWLVPVIKENLTSGEPVKLSAATVASWARYAEGVDEQGELIDVQDQLADSLVPLAKSQLEHPTAFIENTALFGDLAKEQRFVDAYLWTLNSLHEVGARATLEALVGGKDSQ
ncbi:MAG: mannitol dehydrogenase family protein, partial [Mycobacterium sp.]